MSLSLTGTGGVFTRIGRFYVAASTLNTARGSTLDTLVTNIVAQFASTHQDVVANIYPSRDAFRATFATFLTELQTESSNGLIQQVNDNTPLSSLDALQAMRGLVDYMTANAQTVNANVVSAVVTAGATNVGTAVCIATVKGRVGANREYLYVENITLRATNSAQDGSTTAGTETYSVASPVAQDDQLSWDWPKGSGVATSITSANPAGSLNLLTNGDFEDFTTNAPDDWTVNAGVAGTNIFQGGSALTTSGSISGATNATPIVLTTTAAHGLTTGATVTIAGVGGNTAANGTWVITVTGASTFSLTGSVGSGSYTSGGTWTGAQFRGSKCLKFTGTGAGVASIQQTLTGLLPLTVYGVNVWLKCNLVPAAGVLEIAFVDGSGAIVADYASVSNSITKTLSAATTSYAALSGFFRTPATMPSTIAVRVRLSTDITSGKSLYLDDLCLCLATEAYVGGPFLAVFPGATNVIVGDYQTVAIANDWGGIIQKGFQQFFNMRQLRLQLPSDAVGGETVPDSLFA